jgi:hypothetical protein
MVVAGLIFAISVLAPAESGYTDMIPGAHLFVCRSKGADLVVPKVPSAVVPKNPVRVGRKGMLA